VAPAPANDRSIRKLTLGGVTGGIRLKPGPIVCNWMIAAGRPAVSLRGARGSGNGFSFQLCPRNNERGSVNISPTLYCGKLTKGQLARRQEPQMGRGAATLCSRAHCWLQSPSLSLAGSKCHSRPSAIIVLIDLLPLASTSLAHSFGTSVSTKGPGSNGRRMMVQLSDVRSPYIMAECQQV